MRGERREADNEIVKHWTRLDQSAAEEQPEDLIKLPSVDQYNQDQDWEIPIKGAILGLV